MSEEIKYSILLTDSAIEIIKFQLEKRNTPDAFFRLGVRGGGCSGYSYVFQFDEKSKEKDLIFYFNGIKVIVDPKSIIYLNGTIVDWDKNLLKQKFVFRNPNVKSECGCSQSFSVK